MPALGSGVRVPPATQTPARKRPPWGASAPATPHPPRQRPTASQPRETGKPSQRPAERADSIAESIRFFEIQTRLRLLADLVALAAGIARIILHKMERLTSDGVLYSVILVSGITFSRQMNSSAITRLDQLPCVISVPVDL